MREIKFRAWHKAEGIKYIGCALPSYKCGWKIMQYTGLKDKNGVEIYEGDIVRENFVEEKNIYHRIEICNTHNSLYVAGYHNGSLETPFHLLTPIEVIGNIYENPELLEVDND